MDTINDKNIIIIGAGAAGLSCAHKLLKKGIPLNNLLILEASDICGGRLRKYPKENNFADFDIELGGEEIHGKKTEYYKLVQNSGFEVNKYWTDNKFYINYNSKFGQLDEFYKESLDVKFIWDLFEEGLYNDEFPDLTLREYLRIKNIPENFFYLANAVIGTEAGTDLDLISMKGYSDLNKAWNAGSNNYLLKQGSHVEILMKIFEDVLERIEYNTEIKKVDYCDENKIKILDRNGNEFLCDILVVTIPVTQLKKLEFLPKLNDSLKSAIDILKMDNCAKIIMRFKNNILPSDSSCVFIPGVVNFYWSASQGKNSNQNIISGFASGEMARILNKLYKKDKNEFIEKILEDLEFGINSKNLKDILEDFMWFDWSDMPYIEGGYTFPVVAEGEARNALRENIDGRIYFAGEATAEWGHIGTIHGAIESGYRVADSI